ncbi:MAG: MFS transporter [Sphingomonadaceae bacterium]|uniref:MFS transporter n=1 Tax=Thermaurantiacus sp. TaxID=2820283 RepID=UPI00298F3015|nr:MFS transporter [Thermaurantiacus sp.]MCS6986338.1 MFS transporter [Sphingomonadaceae bacterium]MDW8414400.1 MFS transporter [Thermaurantiacus sp.]
MPYNTIGFMMPHMAREFGWSFGAMSLGITIFGVLASALAPVFGGWADRFGARRVAIASLLLFGLSFAAFALVGPSLWSFYAVWVLVGLVGIGSTPVTFSRIVNLWFVTHRGLALGLMLLGSSLAALVLPPLVTWAIGAHGWRMAHVVVAGLPLLVGLPLVLALVREPRAPVAADAPIPAAGVRPAEAFRDRRFWTIFASIFLVALAYGGAHIHMPEIARLNGLTPPEAARVMQVLALAILAGRVVTGYLLDRFWAPAVCLPILCLPAAAALTLAGTSPGFAAIAGAAFLLGFAAGAESDLIAYLASRYFGMAHYGRIYGALYMAFGLSSAISPALYGRVRDLAGTYEPMLIAASGLFVLGALLLLTLGRYPVLRPAEAAA